MLGGLSKHQDQVKDNDVLEKGVGWRLELLNVPMEEGLQPFDKYEWLALLTLSL